MKAVSPSHIQRNDPGVFENAQRLSRRVGQIRGDDEWRLSSSPERKVRLLFCGSQSRVPDLEHVEIVEPPRA